MHRGYIKLWRKFKDWDWYDDHNTCRLFIYLLLSVNHTEKKWKGEVIKPGSIITGRYQLAKETGLTPSQIRTSLDKLKMTSDITIKTTNKYSLISINNWNDYQQNHQQHSQQIANKSPLLKNDKKEKNDNNINIYVSKFNKLFNKQFKVTMGRKTKLNNRLKVFKFEQIMTALENLAMSDFHRGKNDRGWQADPDFLIRNDEQIDKWLNEKSNKKPKQKLILPGE